MPRTTYPESVIELIDDRMTFPPAVMQAVQAFAVSGPWDGSLRERKEKFMQLNRDLADAYAVPAPDLVFCRINGSHSGKSHYVRDRHRIVLTGRLSVVTLLHEHAHSRGLDEHEACRWSINMFRRCFPQQYGRLIQVGHALMKPSDAVAVIAHNRAVPARTR